MFTRHAKENYIHKRWGNTAVRRFNEYRCDFCNIVYNRMISRPELLLKEQLEKRFEDVLHQAPIDHGGKRPWLVDFYVKEIDTYVEVDGVFWHGINNNKERPSIVRKKDKVKNQWFAENNHRLVRITDKEVEACDKSNDYEAIWNMLRGRENRYI